MASWMHVTIALVILTAKLASADQCETKDKSLRDYYKDSSDCNKVDSILSKDTACSDSDKKYLVMCLPKKTADWNYILDNCQEDSDGGQQPTDPTEEPDTSMAPAEGPSDEDAVGALNDALEGRKLLAASKSSLPCMDLFIEYGWDEFKSAAAMPRFPVMVMGLLGAASMLLMLTV